MKKKIVSLALVVALIAIAAMGTLAYFTDTDDATNTFTTGDVAIDAPIDECDVVLRSVSGRIRTSGVSIMEQSAIKVRVNSVSGGLDLNRLIPD